MRATKVIRFVCRFSHRTVAPSGGNRAGVVDSPRERERKREPDGERGRTFGFSPAQGSERRSAGMEFGGRRERTGGTKDLPG